MSGNNKGKMLQVFPLLIFLLTLEVSGQNIGGKGVSEKDAMAYYLSGNENSYPNLLLKLWN